MKYRLLANGTLMHEGSSLAVLNALVNMLKANTDRLDIRVEYLSKTGWKLENAVVVEPPAAL